MLQIQTCKRNNLCVDCNDEHCLRKGDPEQDCPKCYCDNTKLHDCDNCEFLKTYADDMRKEYLKNDFSAEQNKIHAKRYTIERYNNILKHLVSAHFQANIDHGMIYTTDDVDSEVLESTVIQAFNRILNISILSIHPENNDTVWIIYEPKKKIESETL